MRALAFWVMALAVLSGCIYGRAEQRLDNGLNRLSSALGGEPSGEPRKLVYRVEGESGRWLHEVVLEHGRYAEKRTNDDGRRFAFGFDEKGAWVAVNGQPARAVDGSSWEALARTRAAVYRMAFASPGANDEATWMGWDRRRWELAFRPAGGKTINLSIDRRRNLPRELDWTDSWTRLMTCDQLGWEQSPDGVVLATARCGAGSFGGIDGSATISGDTRRLLSMEGLAHLPSWARPGTRDVAKRFVDPVWFPITDPHRIRLPVRFNGKSTDELVLDSGAFHTVISEEVAAAAGVMPTGEPPLFVNPPFLDRSELWIGVVDTLQVGNAVLHAERVLVARNPRMLAGEKGLLGESFFRNYIIDIDSPKRSVRVWDRGTFAPSNDQKRVRLAGTRPRIDGSIRDVASGQILLDTGMPHSILVNAPMMSIANKRQRGTDAHLSAKDGTGASPDYYTTIRGLRLGPITFPSMGAMARDRDREKLGLGVAAPNIQTDDDSLALDLGAIKVEVLRPNVGTSKPQYSPNTGSGIAMVGMGVMRYLRLTFDMRTGFLFVSTGPAYDVLIKLGADIERGAVGPTVSRVLDNGPAHAAGLAEGDVITAVNGTPVTKTDDALARIASHHGFYCHLEVLRNETKRHIMVDVARPLTANQRW